MADTKNRLRILQNALWHSTACIDVMNELAGRHDILFTSTRRALQWLADDDWKGCFDPRITIRVEYDRARKNPIYYAQRTRTLIDAMCGFKADIIHMQGTSDHYVNHLMIAQRRLPFVLTVHDPKPHLGEGDRFSSEYAKHFPIIKETRRRADWIIVHGEDVKRQLLEVQPELDSSRISVVLLGATSYMLRWRKPEYLERPGNLLFFGRINAYKGLGVLLEAWQSVRDACPHARLVVAGSGHDLPNYRDRILADARCELIDRELSTPEVAKLFAETSIVILPYLEATQSGPLALAAAFGKASVVTEVGGLPELMDRDGSGLLVPPNDPKAFADAVIRLLKDDDLRTRFAAQADSLNSGRLGAAHLAAQTEDVYRKAIERKRK